MSFAERNLRMDVTQTRKVYLLLGIGIIIISFSGILIKISNAPPLIIAFYRMLFSIIIFAPYFIIKYRDRVRYFFDYRPAVGGFFLAIHFFLWITAFGYTNVANAVIFIALQPLFSLFLELLFARDDLRKGVLWGILLALTGSLIIGIGDLNILYSKMWGDLLAIAATFFAATYLFIGRSLRKEMDYIPYLFIVYTYTTFFLLLFTKIKGLPFTGYEEINYLYSLGLAVGPTLISHSIFNYSVRYIPTTIVSLAILGEPILTTFYAWILLGEIITPVTLLGAAFILAGIYRTTMFQQKIQEVL
jgi:drug/metabolite transporter (DMT)-like permease